MRMVSNRGEKRWYKGVKPCIIVSRVVTILGTVKVQWDDGSFDIAPVRMCWRKPKAGGRK